MFQMHVHKWCARNWEDGYSTGSSSQFAGCSVRKEHPRFSGRLNCCICLEFAASVTQIVKIKSRFSVFCVKLLLNNVKMLCM